MAQTFRTINGWTKYRHHILNTFNGLNIYPRHQCGCTLLRRGCPNYLTVMWGKDEPAWTTVSVVRSTPAEWPATVLSAWAFHSPLTTRSLQLRALNHVFIWLEMTRTHGQKAKSAATGKQRRGRYRMDIQLTVCTAKSLVPADFRLTFYPVKNKLEWKTTPSFRRRVFLNKCMLKIHLH